MLSRRIIYTLILIPDKAERLMEEAAGLGSQLIVFPEAFIGGYPKGLNFTDRTTKGRESYSKYHAAAIDVPGIIVHVFDEMPARILEILLSALHIFWL